MDQKPEILVVDDNVDLALNLKDILEGEGYNTAVAYNGQAALAICAEKVFDLAFIDVRLPDTPGVELVDKLAELLPGTEYVIITGNASLDSAIAAVEHKSVVAYQTKPLDMNHLLSLTRQVIRRKRAEEQKRKLEAQLQQARKMESIGTLAGGIAHDFNNLLSMILGNISMAKEDVKPEYGISEFLNGAEKASFQAKKLTHRLITFSRGGAPVRKTASIIKLLKESANRALAGSNAMCDFSIPENLWFVEHDEAQMTHVINNLITNAIESMPGGGTIKLTAENLIIGADDKKPALPLQDGTYVKISIRDQGIGIPEKDLPKVFDHYFSTKERGVQKGMGLGLAAVYSIIKRHDGHIAVESRVGVGTTFDIYLPAASAERKEFSAQRKPRSETAPVKGKILVMEDEEALRELSGKMLERLGYEAELAKDGAEAIELYKRAMDAGEPFDAVILDLSVQGGLGGKQAIQKLQEMDGEVKAIVSSGYTDDPVMCNFRQYGFSAALNKTYLKKDMSEALDKVLVEENIW